MLSHVTVSLGGQEYTIVRFTEWLEGQYTVLKYDNAVSIQSTIPVLVGAGNVYSDFSYEHGNFHTNDWLYAFLEARNLNINTLIEIIIPNSMAAAVSIDALSTNIKINDVGIDLLNANTALGTITINNAAIGYLNANTSLGTIIASDSHFINGGFNSSSGRIHLSNLYFDILDINTASGEIAIELAQNVSNYSILVYENTGSAILGGWDIQSYELFTSGKFPFVSISTNSGRIFITCPDGTVGSRPLSIEVLR